MSRIVVTEFISLDGVIDEPRWTFQFERGPEGMKFKVDELFDCDALLLGRVTYQGFAQAWPSMGTDDFGKRMNSVPKYVVSSTLTDAEADWGPTTVIRGDVVAEVTRLKAQPGGNLLLEGSAQLAQTLIGHDLVDEYRLMVFPIVLGAGKRLFPPEVKEHATLTLADARPGRGITARARIATLLAWQGMVAEALAVSRVRPALTWRALDGDLVAGEVSARLRPDDRWFVYFDTWRTDAYPPLADAVARELGRDLYVTLEDAEYDALDACAEAGFAVHRRESYYRIPTDPAATGLAGAVLPAGLDVLSAAGADITRLRLLDDALRQDVPGCEGWRWDAEQFRAETFSAFFDPATYLVAVDRASGEYAGLVRIWRNRAGPRLGLIATLARYRRRGIARALLGQAFTVLAAQGEASAVGEVDDTNVASVSLLTQLGARRYGGNVELIRPQPTGTAELR